MGELSADRVAVGVVPVIENDQGLSPGLLGGGQVAAVAVRVAGVSQPKGSALDRSEAGIGLHGELPTCDHGRTAIADDGDLDAPPHKPLTL